MFNDPWNKTLELDCGIFEDYIRSHSTDPKKVDVQYVFQFRNGYGASVIKFQGSYGYEADLWELAVIRFDEDGASWELCYDTPIGDDVFGWCTDEKVRELLGLIKYLPGCEEE